jgi:hypothetical protein
VLLRCIYEHTWLCWGDKLYKVSVFCVCSGVEWSGVGCIVVYFSSVNLHCVTV